MPPRAETEAIRLLLVDDDDLFRETLASAFARRGFVVEQAASGRAALQLVERFTPQWAVIDIRMPEQLGLSLVEPLLETIPPLTIVVLTGYGTISTAVQAIKLGAHNYLTKPADVDDIIAAFSEDSQHDDSQQIALNAASATLSEVEREHIQRVLADCDGNISHAAKRLGIHRRSLQRKLNSSDSGRS